jgi:hypothetical protein
MVRRVEKCAHERNLNMPGHKALNSNQLVVGCDVHKQMPPMPPAGPVVAPHRVVGMMGSAMKATSKQSTTVKAGSGYALGRQHDLGMGTCHIAPNLLLPLVTAGAGNKAEFGSSTVKVRVGKDSLRMAVAVDGDLGLNLQLDCNEPCPAPSSLCVASFNTVKAGFTVGDCVGGYAAMAADTAVSWAASKFIGGVAKKAAGPIAKQLGKSAWATHAMAAAKAGIAAHPATAESIRAAANVAASFVVGSPLGYSPQFAGVNVVYPSENSDAINDQLPPALGLPAASPSPTSSPKGPQAPKRR